MAKNVKWEITGDILTVKVDLSKERWPSKTGTTELVASTQGNEPLGNNFVMGLNVYFKKEKG